MQCTIDYFRVFTRNGHKHAYTNDIILQCSLHTHSPLNRSSEVTSFQSKGLSVCKASLRTRALKVTLGTVSPSAIGMACVVVFDYRMTFIRFLHFLLRGDIYIRACSLLFFFFLFSFFRFRPLLVLSV
jgi:hypothetical protein